MMTTGVPTDVFLDTTIAIGCMYPGTPDSLACRRFCDALIEADSRVYFSQALRFDLSRALRRLATKPDKLPAQTRSDYALDHWGASLSVRERWLNQGVARFDAFVAQFAEVVEVTITNRVWLSSLSIMAQEGLDATDAFVLAAARDLGAPLLATTDGDFRRITSPTVLILRDDPR